MPEFTESMGWMPGVEYLPFPHADEQLTATPAYDMYPQAIVHHVAQGREGGVRSMTLTSYHNPDKIGWHFTILRNGNIIQHASIWQAMRHCGIRSDVTPHSTVRDLRQKFLTDPFWAPKYGGDGANPNAWTVGVEHEGFSIPAIYNGKPTQDYLYDTEHPWPEAMIQSSIRVQRWIWTRCQWLMDLGSGPVAQDRFLTHAMIDPKNRPQDPGALWDGTVWHRIVNGVLLSEPSEPPKPAPAPVQPAPTPTPPPATIDQPSYNMGWNAAIAEVAKRLEGLVVNL